MILYGNNDPRINPARYPVNRRRNRKRRKKGRGKTNNAIIGTLHSTGQGLSIGDPDSHYTLSFSTEQGVVPRPVTVSTEPNWTTNDPSSAWVGFAGDVAIGDYIIFTVFDLTDFNPETVVLFLAIGVDNVLNDIRLNGASLGLTATGCDFTFFTIDGGFIPGLNMLEFLWENKNGPTGIRIRANGTAVLY
jgi:hypothetical protein